MSKIVLISYKDRKHNPYSHRDIEILSKRLMPDNILPNPPLIIDDRGVIIVILNPSDTLPIKSTSVCMGNLIDPKDDWWKPLADVPDGSYALFRTDENTVELVSDIVASRTIWYIRTEDIFIASTSQRAIIFFLQDFKMNKTTISWMLSSGTLGPGLSWDKRIQCLGGNSRLFLDRSSWKLATQKERPNFDRFNLPNKEHEIQLRKGLKDTFEHLSLDYSKWFLPLSGGYDSRAILLMLKNQKDVNCITWGLESSLYEKNNDAYVAKALAEHFDVEHKYFETDISNEPIEKIFNRFFMAGEGRIDQISAYMDGFKIWKLLFEEGISGIIRGDEGFGWRPVLTSHDVRRSVGVNLSSDYSNLKDLETFGLEKQSWPESLQRKNNESLATWRDRLYHEFRIPFFLAPLTDLKCSYVEVINPLLSRRIIVQVRRMPDSLRTDKKLFKKIVDLIGPEIRFAKYPAIAEPKNILKTEEVVDLISIELNTSKARNILSDKFVDYILKNMKREGESSNKNKRSLEVALQPIIPTTIVNISRNTIFKQQMDFNVLAFRAYMISKMNQIFTEDATSLN